MFVKWIRNSNISSGILVIFRLLLGYTFLSSGYYKVSCGFDATGFLQDAIANPIKGPQGDILNGSYISFLKGFVLPNVDIFNAIGPLAELLIGLGLILGCFTTAAAFFGLVMNFSYLMAGTVSFNPFDIFFGIFILFSGYNAGRCGLDYWMIPYIRKTLFKQNDHAAHRNG